MKIIVIDTETTDKDPSTAELLQVSIISGSERVLFNEYIKPTYATSWPDAMRVNHIYPDMVKNCKTIDYYVPKIQKIIDRADIVVGYNLIKYDIPVLENAGISFRDNIVDVYIERKDDPLERHRLVDVAKSLGYTFNPHDSLEDCKATLHIYNKTHSAKRNKKNLAKDNNDNDLKEAQISSSAGDENAVGKKWVIVKNILKLVLGTISIIGLSRLAQGYLNLDVGLIIAMTVAGLYCYLFSGLIGPFTCTLGYCISHFLEGDLVTCYLFAIVLFASTILLRILLKFAQRYKNIFVKFLMCSFAMIISIYMFFVLAFYLQSYTTGISLNIYQSNIKKPLLTVLIIMELCLPVYILAGKLLKKY